MTESWRSGSIRLSTCRARTRRDDFHSLCNMQQRHDSVIADEIRRKKVATAHSIQTVYTACILRTGLLVFRLQRIPCESVNLGPLFPAMCWRSSLTASGKKPHRRRSLAFLQPISYPRRRVFMRKVNNQIPAEGHLQYGQLRIGKAMRIVVTSAFVCGILTLQGCATTLGTMALVGLGVNAAGLAVYLHYRH
jgi:hypothetical protein